MLDRLLTIGILALPLLLPIPAQAFRNEGWWIVVGTYPADSIRMGEEVMAAEARGRRCGLKVWNEWSGKFVGFQPGYHVIVLKGEPIAAQERAKAIVARARRCYPDAYAKHARYLGE